MPTTVSLPARFYAGTLTNAEVGVWTVPAAETDVITSITVQNITLVAQTFDVKMAGTFLAYQLSLPPQTLDFGYQSGRFNCLGRLKRNWAGLC